MTGLSLMFAPRPSRQYSRTERNSSVSDSKALAHAFSAKIFYIKSAVPHMIK